MNARSILLVAACVAIPAASHAYVREMSNWDPSTLPIHYGINLGSAPSTLGMSGAQTAVEGGFATWAGPSCTSWRSADDGNTSRTANTSDRLNTIIWLSGTWPPELGDVNSTIGITTPVWETPGYFIDADIQFNNVGFRWNMSGSAGTVDAQSIATHEEGHFLGLDHTPVASAIMYASYSGGIKRTLDPDDQMGVCAIYPSGVTPPPSDSGTMPPPDTGSSSTGSGTTGMPCTSGADCISGICVNDGHSTFCSQVCPSDCGCPTGYACFPTGGPMVCAPGTNTCMTAHDSGAMPMTGTGQLGDPCARQVDCSGSAPFCIAPVGSSQAFCSRACVDDCSCPVGYLCGTLHTSSGTTSVCGPVPAGLSRMCSTDVHDGGISLVDSGSDGARPHDGGTGTASPGCNCSTPGATGSRFGALVALGAVTMMLRRRRR